MKHGLAAWCVLALGLLIVLSGFLGVVAAASQGNATGQVADDYAIVRFAKDPVAEYSGGLAGYLATKPLHGHKLDLASAPVISYQGLLGSEHRSYQAWLHANAPQVQIVRDYMLSFNGVAVLLNGASLSALTHGPDAVDAQPSWLYQPTMDFSVPLIGADQVWDQIVPSAPDTASLYSGLYASLASVKVGVIDSGILDTHPFIASCRAENPVVHRGPYFSGLPFGVPIVETHGTHVAGTIGGCLKTDAPDLGGGLVMPYTSSAYSLGHLSGVAPGVTLYDYNVFPGMGVGYYKKQGSAFSHDIMAAVEDAVRDGMNVISLSLGGGVQGPNDLLSQAINDAVDAGVVAVVAAGNSGPNFMTVESPGNAANAITVAAASNRHFAANPVSPDGKGPYAGIPGDFGSFTGTVTANYIATTPADGCSAITNAVAGDVFVINRGTCSFSTKIGNAQKTGAIAVIMVNNQPGDPIIMGQDGTPNQPTIPAVMVSQADGANFAASGTVTIQGTVLQEFVSAYPDVIASFSGRGPTPYNFLLKPDVTAPGENVLSSVFSVDLSGATPVYTPYYAFFQGTSMATPHVTGSVALLLALHPDWTPAEIKSAIVDTAYRPVWSSVAMTAGVSALARGGGLLNVPAATDTPVAISPASLSFGITMGSSPIVGMVPMTFTGLGAAASCSLSVTGGGAAAVSVSATTVAVPATGSADITATLNAGRGASVGFYTGDVVAQCTAAGVTTTLRVPFLFVVGGSLGWLQGNMNSRNPPGFGTAADEFTAPAGYAAGSWIE